MADERIKREETGFGNQAEEEKPRREKRRETADSEDSSNKKRRPSWVKWLLWLLRKSIVPIIMIIMLTVGLYAGYVVVGKQSAGEVFEWSTWRHLYDLIFAES